MISHFLEDSPLVKLLLCCLCLLFSQFLQAQLVFCLTVLVSSLQQVGAASKRCQQTREVSASWANVSVYKEVWGNVNSFHVQPLLAPLYTMSPSIFSTFPIYPINLHFSRFLVLPKLSGAILGCEGFHFLNPREI